MTFGLHQRHRSAVGPITFSLLVTPFSHLHFHLSHVPLPSLSIPSPDKDEFPVLSISAIRRNRRLLFFLGRFCLFKPPSFSPVSEAFSKFSPKSFPTILSSFHSSLGSSITQDICHLSFPRRPRIVHCSNPDSPIPNRTDACRTFRSLITIPNVPFHLATHPPKIVSGSYQPARICACLACLVDPLAERLEIFIDSRPAFCSGTRNRGRI